jgi:restriction system protein
MGALWSTINDFFDQSAEIVGIKSGLLLSNNQIKHILQEGFDDSFLISSDGDETIRIRSDEMSDMIRYIRVRIGNLPSPEQYEFYESILEQFLYYGEILSIYNKWGLLARHNYVKKESINHGQLKRLIVQSEKLPMELIDSMVYLIMRELDGILVFPEIKTIKNITKLEDLFKYEIHPKDDNTFIDQKFLDYLAINGAEIESIHWRNFERLCAQYFAQKGFMVKLGPGTKDGGIDIKVFSTGYKKARPLIIIQCKRYSKQRKVAIESIKAFHSDLKFENAKYGLIATTSKITTDGKKLVKARNYNITFAENKMIKKWAKEMGSHL